MFFNNLIVYIFALSLVCVAIGFKLEPAEEKHMVAETEHKPGEQDPSQVSLGKKKRKNLLLYDIFLIYKF